MSKALDELIKRLVVQVRGHDQSVLRSYARFVKLTSNQLGLDVNVIEGKKFLERWTILKSRFSNRKHMRQYEMRTHFQTFEFTRLTGSTSDTLLEYIQRNLPEGVAMHVHTTKCIQLPEFIVKDIEKKLQDSKIDS
jgi:small subunit ribosomal protein S10